MRIVQIAVPIEWEEKIRERMRDREVESMEEYIHDLIEWDLPDELDAETEQKLLEGLASGPGQLVEDEFWADRRRELDEHIAKKKQ